MLHLRMVRTRARDFYSAKPCPLMKFRSCSLGFRRRNSLRDKNYTTESPLMGHSRRFGDVRVTSALPPKADIRRDSRHVSNVPQPEVPSTREWIAPPWLPDSVADERPLTFWENAMYQPKVPITSAAEVKAILGPDIPSQIVKVIDHIDVHCKAWIERCPFIVISSVNAAGAMDTSPKGDPPGFVKILDKHTLAIPDRLGNHRGDTFFNVLENPSVGIVFVVPKRREVVRVSGMALLARDPDLLAGMAVSGKLPDLAMIVRV
jgi:predicted pyridoxine 5'-phosphate oxidase superfamily flavin-nucleotide-binding protein